VIQLHQIKGRDLYILYCVSLPAAFDTMPNPTIEQLNEAALGANRPNFVLVMKVEDARDNFSGTQIRKRLCQLIRGNNWNTPNVYTSQFYYQRHDGVEAQFLAAQNLFMQTIQAQVKTNPAHNYDWHITWIILKTTTAHAEHDIDIADLFG